MESTLLSVEPGIIPDQSVLVEDGRIARMRYASPTERRRSRNGNYP